MLLSKISENIRSRFSLGFCRLKWESLDERFKPRFVNGDLERMLFIIFRALLLFCQLYVKHFIKRKALACRDAVLLVSRPVNPNKRALQRGEVVRR